VPSVIAFTFSQLDDHFEAAKDLMLTVSSSRFLTDFGNEVMVPYMDASHVAIFDSSNGGNAIRRAAS
jgi:hypothetical protein